MDTANNLTDLLTRGVVNIIPDRPTLQKRLESGEKLHIYLGIDPTATHIHLGHAIPLRKLQACAELGHHVTFLIGDFTALIGDTSDKDTERPVLTKEQIEENFQTYKAQAEKVLDFNMIDIKYNSEWLHTLNFEEIVKLCQHFSANDLNSRELIRKRLDEGKRVGLHEFLYPVMQGYDSYHLNTDVQIGGADQTFNMQAGRTLIKELHNKDSFVLATDYLPGTDGRKMSKSWGNAIWLDDSPEDMYAKVMAITDELIDTYYTLATNLPTPEVEAIKQELANGGHPMNIKKNLARQIVAELYDTQAAEEAQNAFEKRVQNKELPQEIPMIEWNASLSIIDNVVNQGLVESKSQAKLLHEQGGLRLEENILHIGKHRVYKIKA